MKNPHHSVGRHNPERLSPLDPFVHHHQESTKQLMAEIPDYVDIGPMDDGYDSMLDTDQRNGLSGDDDLDPEENGPILPEPGSYVPSNCSTCVRREELRRRNLEVIKDQILSKLGMQRAPNMTGRLPPRIPPLDHLLDLYGMQGDAPGDLSGGFQTGTVYDEEEDDFHARTEKVIAFAQQRKFASSFMFYVTGMLIHYGQSIPFLFNSFDAVVQYITPLSTYSLVCCWKTFNEIAYLTCVVGISCQIGAWRHFASRSHFLFKWKKPKRVEDELYRRELFICAAVSPRE